MAPNLVDVVTTSNLYGGIGRIRVFTDIFQRALRREFLHDTTALLDWDGKMRLLGGVMKAAQDMVRGYEAGQPLSKARRSYSALGGSRPDRLRTATVPQPEIVQLNQYLLNLVECFTNSAGKAVRSGRKDTSRATERAQIPEKVLQALYRALAQIAHLESALYQWQAQLPKPADDEAHADVRVPLGWESHHVIEQAFAKVHRSLESTEAIDVCVQTRQLFLANYYHATISIRQWTEAQHEDVVRLHDEALRKLSQLRAAESDEREATFNRQCEQSIQWRREQLTSTFNWRRFKEIAVEPPEKAAESRDVHRTCDPLPQLETKNAHVEFGQLRVLLFGPKNWQLALERQVENHVLVISGSDALIRRDHAAHGFQRILIHSDELDDQLGHYLREVLSQDPRVLVVVPPTRAGRLDRDLPPLWTWETISRELMDANWLVWQCMRIGLPQPARSAAKLRTESTLDPCRIMELNRRESIADLACHLLDRLLHEGQASSTDIRALEVFDRLKDFVARIGEEVSEKTVHKVDDEVVRWSVSVVDSLKNASAKVHSCDDERPTERWLVRQNWLMVTLLLVSFFDERARIEESSAKQIVIHRNRKQASSSRNSICRRLIREHGFTEATLLGTLKQIAERNRAELDWNSDQFTISLL